MKAIRDLEMVGLDKWGLEGGGGPWTGETDRIMAQNPQNCNHSTYFGTIQVVIVPVSEIK